MYYTFMSCRSDVSATPHFCKGETLKELAEEVFVVLDTVVDGFLFAADLSYKGLLKCNGSYEPEEGEEDEEEFEDWAVEIDSYLKLKEKLENNKKIFKSDIAEISIMMSDIEAYTEDVYENVEQLVDGFIKFVEDKAMIYFEEFSEIYEGEITQKNASEIEEAIDRYLEEYTNDYF